MSKSDKSSLLSKWLRKSGENHQNSKNKIGEIEIIPGGISKRLSYGQLRLWTIQQLYPKSYFYNYAEIYHIEGFIEKDKLQQSVEVLIDRQEILRTTFDNQNEDVVQVVHPKMDIHVKFESLKNVVEYDADKQINIFANQMSKVVFDLIQGPLLKIGLLTLSESKHILIVNMHHIITDKWSMRIFREELTAIYNAKIKGVPHRLPPVEVNYASFAHWQRNKKINEKQLSYWLKKLQDYPQQIDLPYDYERSQIPSFSGAFSTEKVEKEISQKVESLCKRYSTTRFIFYLSVFNILLHKYARQQDVLVGTPISNRNKSSLEKTIGFFNDTLILRSILNSEDRYSDYLKITKSTVLEAFSNKEIPFEILVKNLEVNREVNINPLFQVMFLHHEVPEKPKWKGLDISYETYDIGVSKFDLTMYVAEDKGETTVTIEFATDLFDLTTIERMQKHFSFILKQITDNPELQMSTISLSPFTELEAIYNLNKNDRTYPSDIGIHDLILKNVNLFPNAYAVTSKTSSWTYSELIQNAKKIAAYLQVSGVQKGEVVAVSTDRSVDMVAAIVGVLMSGGVYMPVDPLYPGDRISYMLEESKTNVILCTVEQEDLFADTEGKIIHYPEVINNNDLPVPDSSVKVKGEDIAYLIFTSGSSGKPKGVAVSHQNIIHSTCARYDFYEDRLKRFLLLSSFAFDSSMAGFFWALCSGGELILTPEKIEQDIDALSGMIQKYGVSHTLMLPSLYQVLLDQSDMHRLHSLECVIVAGEACTSKLVKTHFSQLQDARLYNEYGPTEASVWCTGYEITRDDIGAGIPIGRAISSTDIFILDEFGHMLPRGIPGEIHIGGRGVTNGYINREDLTREKFIEHQFEQEYPSLLYRSGDLGKMRMDGVIEFLGRVDQQIKIRGFRVELSEIQNVLQSVSDFTEIVVIAVKDKEENAPNKAKMIVAYYVAERELDAQKIKNDISLTLPDYMVPTFFIKLDEIPKLPNGKYDIRRLEQMDYSSQNVEKQTIADARNETEALLVSIWKDVLGVKSIGIYDNFFALGGDSILSIQINGRARNQGLKFPANEIFKSQTIAELARNVELEKEQAGNDAIYSGEIELTPIQHWYFDHFKNATNHWHLGFRFDLGHPLNDIHFAKALQTVVERHEALRTVFDETNEATVLPFQDVFLEKIDLTSEDEAVETLICRKIESVCTNTNLIEGPLFKCLLFNRADGSSTLAILAHHLIIDLVSWNIIVDNLTKAMQLLANGDSIKLDPKSISYQQWADFLRRYSTTPEFRHDMTFWKNEFLDYSFEKGKETTFKESDVIFKRYRFESDLTKIIINALPASTDSQINEIFIAAISKVLYDWKEKDLYVVETEGHGREQLEEEQSFHNSVGWFTSVFPLFVRFEAQGSFAHLKYIKNKVRSIPSKGLTFGICKYLATESKPKDYFAYKADVLFNYLGRTVEMQSEILGKAQSLQQGMRSEDSERLHPLEFNVYLQGEELILDCTYVDAYAGEKDMDKLIDGIRNEIETISVQSKSSNTHNYVPADFEDVDLEEDDLDALFEQF